MKNINIAFILFWGFLSFNLFSQDVFEGAFPKVEGNGTERKETLSLGMGISALEVSAGLVLAKPRDGSKVFSEVSSDLQRASHNEAMLILKNENPAAYNVLASDEKINRKIIERRRAVIELESKLENGLTLFDESGKEVSARLSEANEAKAKAEIKEHNKKIQEMFDKKKSTYKKLVSAKSKLEEIKLKIVNPQIISPKGYGEYQKAALKNKDGVLKKLFRKIAGPLFILDGTARMGLTVIERRPGFSPVIDASSRSVKFFLGTNSNSEEDAGSVLE